MRYYWLVLGALGVWRLTHLLNAEDGPAEVLVRLRAVAGSGFWGSLLDCFYCLSLWVSAPFALVVAEGWRERLLLWLALSGAASLLERATGRDTPGALPARYLEYEEEDNVVLRQSERTISGDSADRANP